MVETDKTLRASLLKGANPFRRADPLLPDFHPKVSPSRSITWGGGVKIFTVNLR